MDRFSNHLVQRLKPWLMVPRLDGGLYWCCDIALVLADLFVVLVELYHTPEVNSLSFHYQSNEDTSDAYLTVETNLHVVLGYAPLISLTFLLTHYVF